MITAEARIDTHRATRYLAQLCDHVGHLQRAAVPDHPHLSRAHRPPVVQEVDNTGRYGVLVVDGGVCTLQALDDALVVRIEAADDDALRRAQAVLGHRIQTIGHRDQLTVTWRRRHGD